MSRRGPLTHMQFLLWLDDATRRPGSTQSVVYATWELAAGVSAKRISDAVHELCERHQALRTGFEVDGQGELWQVLRPARPPEIVYLEADSDLAVSSGAERLVEDLQGSVFRLEADPLLRVGVVTRDHRPRQIVVVVHHIACDAWSMRILQVELEALIRRAAGNPDTAGSPDTAGNPDAAGSPDLPAPGLQPLDQAGEQESAAGRRQAERALAYLREQFRLVPPRLFADPPAGSLAPHLRARLVMPLDGPSLATLAQRCGTTPNVVIAAAYNVVLSLQTGHARCPIVLSSSNRYTAKVKGSVGPFFGTVPMSCDLSGDPRFSVVIGRVRDAYLPALRHSSYPVDTMKEIRARESFRRGVAMRVGINFGTYTDERYQAEKLAMATWPVGEVILEETTSNPGMEVGLTAGLDATSCLLILTAAGHILDPDRAGRLLLAIRLLLTTALSGADPRICEVRRLAGITGPDRHAGWVELDNTWVDLAQTEAMLNEHPAVERAVVFGPADWPSEAELVGCVTTRQPDLTPYALRRYLVASSQANATIMAPHRYLIRSDVPDRLRDPSAWQAPGQLADGHGLTAPARPALTPQEAALCQAVARANDLPQVSPDDCYLLSGHLRRLPAVITELRRLGYHPPPYDHFTGWHTLAESAPLLRATAASEAASGVPERVI